jgi:hypothetical protein
MATDPHLFDRDRPEGRTGELVPLGEGPAATVFAGVDEVGAAFALKVYRRKLDRRTNAELEAELTAIRALRGHVPVLVADKVEQMSDGRCALRMELCAHSLTELVGSFGPLSVADALALGETLATTLVSAHKAGIVHGAVTPGNVLFRPSGEAVLADFGLTLRRAFPQEVDRVIDFVPPETLRDGSMDDRSDLYGLGAVLYLALSGTSPHHGPSGEQHGERVLRVLGGSVPELRRSDAPPGLTHLVSALLAKDPDARPLDATTVLTRLGAMTGPGAPQAFDDSADPPPAVFPRGEPILTYGPTDKQRRSRSGPVIAVLAALSVLAVVAVLLLLNSPAELDVPAAPTPAAAPNATGSPQPAVQVELADPVDRGDHVELSWRSTALLDFAVVVMAEGEPSRTVYVRRSTSYRAEVDPDPGHGYCFLVQGVDSANFYTSPSKPIRGAACGR